MFTFKVHGEADDLIDVILDFLIKHRQAVEIQLAEGPAIAARIDTANGGGLELAPAEGFQPTTHNTRIVKLESVESIEVF